MVVALQDTCGERNGDSCTGVRILPGTWLDEELWARELRMLRAREV